MTGSMGQSISRIRVASFFLQFFCVAILVACGAENSSQKIRGAAEAPTIEIPKISTHRLNEPPEADAGKAEARSATTEDAPTTSQSKFPSLVLVSSAIKKSLEDPTIVQDLATIRQIILGRNFRAEIESDPFAPEIVMGDYHIAASSRGDGENKTWSFLWPRMRISGTAYRIGAYDDPSMRNLNTGIANAFCAWLGFSNSTEFRVEADNFSASVPQRDRVLNSSLFYTLPRYEGISPKYRFENSRRYVSYIDSIRCGGEGGNPFKAFYNEDISVALEQLDLSKTKFMDEISVFINDQFKRATNTIQGVSRFVTLNDDASVSLLYSRIMFEGKSYPVIATQESHNALCRQVGFYQATQPNADEDPEVGVVTDVVEFRNEAFIPGYGQPSKTIRCVVKN